MKIKFIGTRGEAGSLTDITYYKVYEIAGIDEDGDMYVIDDVGDRNFACSGNGGNGRFITVEL